MQSIAHASQHHDHAAHLEHYRKVGDLVDQCIDLMLNLRQSGHPGGSRSKVPLLVSATLGPGMRFDIRRPELAFGDRFVLVAGHCAPAVYALLAVYNEALRARHQWTGDARFVVPHAAERELVFEDLLHLRHQKGLPGHAEMEGKTLFFKFNTGPSAHGAPAAMGEALALKHAGASQVKVFAVEGEGGHSAGAHHEVKHTAWGLGLDNLVYLFDWNDHGIDHRAHSEVVHGTPEDWFAPYGWRVAGAEDGEDYGQICAALERIVNDPAPGGRPGVVWVRTRKGRGYHKYDAPSHGKSHARNSDLFWRCRQDFAEKYGVQFAGHGDTTDPGEDKCREQTRAWFATVREVLRNDRGFLEWLTDTLIAKAESVPLEMPGSAIRARPNLHEDRSWLAADKLPAGLFVAPGTKIANKEGFAKFGAWVNETARAAMGRPLVIACSADLAESTSIHGFSLGFTDPKQGFGWYERAKNPGGALLPTQITEFSNSGLCAGLSSVNMAADPEKEFCGYWSAHSTYGSFGYLMYGMMRLYSQLAQDCPLKVGKIIWVLGHSGPETAEDSRTHFGIFAPGVSQLFPAGKVVNLHPWEHNEVAPMLAAALRGDAPIIALHLTRPNVAVPDRKLLGVAGHMEAAKGCYVIRDHDRRRPKDGTILVQGTSTTESVFQLLPRFAQPDAPNIKLLAATSWELFQQQPREYQDFVLPRGDWLDSTVITNGARRLMHDWLSTKVAEAYAMSPDFDDRWRTGGSVDEVKKEAHIDPEHLWQGIVKFAKERQFRLSRLGHPGD